MKIVLATGIYPPEIGGPATYVCSLVEELKKHKHEVTVLTYAHRKSPTYALRATAGRQIPSFDYAQDDTWKVIQVNRSIPIFRWVLYAMALRKHAKEADMVYAFSSVSVGVPLVMWKYWPFGYAQGKSKLLLRLGGDFIWERYTAAGGTLSLREWYESLHWSLRLSHRFMHRLLNVFDHIIFSTRLQEEIYEEFYQSIPFHSVIENAIPAGLPRSFDNPILCHTERSRSATQSKRAQDKLRIRRPGSLFRLLFMGRFVGFKNLFTLLDAVKEIPHVTLALVGEGPLKKNMLAKILRDGIADRVEVRGSVYGEEKDKLFKDHDLLIIPSTTEISPNTALEAKAAGLPVLLTDETGLSMDLQKGMIVRPLRTKEEIHRGILECERSYDDFVKKACVHTSSRSWDDVCAEHLALFKKIL